MTKELPAQKTATPRSRARLRARLTRALSSSLRSAWRDVAGGAAEVRGPAIRRCWNEGFAMIPHNTTRVRQEIFSETLPNLSYMLFLPLVGESKFIFQAFLKVENGVKWIVQFSAERPTVSQMTDECLQNGTLSARPYVAGQPADLSTQECVLALYHHYCSQNGFDPTSLLARAYPGFEPPQKWTPEAWRSVREGAQWHGTTFPDVWLEEDEYNLLLSLYSQGLRGVAETLMDEKSLRSPLTDQGEPS